MTEREFNKVEHPESSLVMCDYDTCPDFGEYMQCYFDIYKRCKQYQEYMKKLEDDVH